MNKTEFEALCTQITKDGPIAGWAVSVLNQPKLSARYLIIKADDSSEEWNVFRYDGRTDVEDLGKYNGKTAFDVYKAVPRKAIA